MDAADLIGAGEISDGACDTQDTMEASCRQAHRCGRVGQELAPGIVRSPDTVEQLPIRLGIGPYTRPAIAVGLNLARRRHPSRDLGASFGGRRQGQIGGGDTLHVDMQIDPVEQRA